MFRYLVTFCGLMTLAVSQGYDSNVRGDNYALGQSQYRDRNFNRPDLRYQNIRNLRTENNNNGDGTYNYFYENDDGTVASQRGFPKTLRSGDGGVAQGNAAEGFYQYYSPEGQLIRVDYVADENGFQPRGDHLPVPPPIPEAIQKSLDLIYSGIEKQKQNPYRQNEYDNYQNPQNRFRPEGGYQTPRPYANRF